MTKAGSINEGIADFYAHIFDERDAVFEYIFGAFTTGYRPIMEEHPLHAANFNTTRRPNLLPELCELRSR